MKPCKDSCRFDAISEIIGHLPVGILILNSAFRIQISNSAAKAILNSKDGLSESLGSLRVATTREQATLNKTLDQVISGSVVNSEWILAMSRKSDRKPYVLRITRYHVSTPYSSAAQSPAVIIFITDPEMARVSHPDSIRELYGLTAAEAQIVSMLVAGKSVNEICSDLDISISTARTHLKHIFTKTDTERQRDVVRLVLSGPAWLGAGLVQ